MVQRLKIDWDIITMIQPRKTIDWTATQVNQDLKKPKWHVATMNRTLSSALSHLSTGYNELPLKSRIKYMLRVIQAVYYPILAIVGLAGVRFSLVWGSIEFVHYIVTPIIPFVLILLLNALTAKHILLKSNVRKRLRNQSNLRNVRDAEMENRRRSITLLFLISANFILLWSTLLVSTLWQRIRLLGYTVWLHRFWRDIGFMLQLLSCCTNTCIYVVTQKLFRKHLKNVLLYLFTLKFQANR
ncbi:uncharacterized protein LOC125448561 isoform X2 [Stegostoma tigrinum]|uniref:uncharacterized protein LOC125448561 isoform X2 n=1 Tax=Stegostoma tigrinum TaxID=3053191 RepID=UPI0028706437|nr:uncharacterized protein LOC125448561 isoform X2 [Stegostoma tigrinum]